MRSLSIAILAATAATPVLAFQGGVQVPVARSGFVLLRSAGAGCTAVAIAPDLLLTSRHCVETSEAQNPELLGWFMGDQDSDDNPVREVSFEVAEGGPFALLRLTRPLQMDSKGAPLYGGEDSALVGTGLRCFSFGPTLPIPYFSYGDTLAYADFRITGMGSGAFLLDPGPSLHPLDLGGACFRAGTSELAGIFVPDPTVIQSGVVVGIARARAWINEFRATFELEGVQSGLCIGNVPNGTRIWQLPCIAAGQPGRVDQEWSIRRFDSRFTIRSGRFPDLCLGAVPGTRGNPQTVQFYGCPAPLTNGSAPWNLPTVPRLQQLWNIDVSNADSIELRNVGTGLCLNVPGNSRIATTNLELATCRSQGVSQQFHFNVDRFAGGTHRLASFAQTRQCMELRGDGQPVRTLDCTGAPAQQFELIRDGLTHNQLIALGLGADGLACASASGTAVVQRACAPGLGQEWLFRWHPLLNGYRVRSRDTDRCLTKGADGGPVTTAACANGGMPLWSQRWIPQ